MIEVAWRTPCKATPATPCDGRQSIRLSLDRLASTLMSRLVAFLRTPRVGGRRCQVKAAAPSQGRSDEHSTNGRSARRRRVWSAAISASGPRSERKNDYRQCSYQQQSSATRQLARTRVVALYGWLDRAVERAVAVAMRRLLPEQPEFQLVDNAGRFSFLTPCGAAALLLPKMLCTDPPGFDRKAFHQKFNASVATFFTESLRDPDSRVVEQELPDSFDHPTDQVCVKDRERGDSFNSGAGDIHLYIIIKVY